MSFFKRDEGKYGEDIAVAYLIKLGFKIIERNFRIRGGEIDIIGLDGDTLVFIEVKTRSSQAYGSPLEAITYWKVKALVKAAHFYKAKHPQLPESMRIDAVAIVLDKQKNVASIELVKNINE